ncbi:unnamed protein product [Macrosiphum euphorbiae]|uniref:Uncharacterized protein n=1 Tax=Macrosiphum euphorbiae TaxID=13131 RepID=A0AAV0VMX4_9HEMI|nr:unnamed protein product [Macrosiphum euphorbiae]
MYAVGCSSLVTTLGSVVNPEDNNIMMVPMTVRGLAHRKLTVRSPKFTPIPSTMKLLCVKCANIDHPLNWLMFGLNGSEIVFNLTATIDGLNFNSKP